ncbi:MAG: CHAT domain-containing protein, partial [Bacteroidota bacterium]
WGEDAVYAFDLNGHQISVRTIGLEIADTVALLSQALNKPDLSPGGYARFQPAARRLFLALFPSQSTSDIKRWIIIPDGVLSYIPFGVFLTEEGSRLAGDMSPQEVAPAFRKLPYLVRKTAIQYAYSTQLLLLDNIKGNDNSNTFLGIAPLYLAADTLRNVETEIQLADPYFDTRYLTAASARIDSFQKYAAATPFIHLAMHGVADLEDPMAAYLDFGEEKLRAAEIYNMRLRAKLVVLSACESGYGRLDQGEGMMSLARAFQYAGAKSVMMSLWKMDGDANLDLMRTFYEQLADQQSAVNAWQQAKIRFLDEAHPREVHPYYWAGSVLHGKDISQTASRAWLKWLMLALVGVLGIIGWWKSR